MPDPLAEESKPRDHRTAVFVVIALTMTILMLGWQVLRTSTLKVDNVTRPAELRLTTAKKQPDNLSVHVTGWIDGTATLALAGSTPTQVGPGNVEWRRDGDFYSSEAVVNYVPRNVTTGHLTVEYRFR